MLRAMVEARIAQGDRLSVLSRRAAAAGIAGASAHAADYYDEAAFGRALDEAMRRSGPIDIAVAWFHTLKIAAARRLAEAVGAPGRPGRLIQVLGSATADPAHPHRLAAAAAVAEGLPNCRLQQVVLGFVAGPGGSRWLTNAEISDGVLRSLASGDPLIVAGQVEPWSARP